MTRRFAHLAFSLVLLAGLAFAGKLDVLHEFNDSDGAGPWTPVTLDKDGSIYGATATGGAYDYGTVFELVRKSGRWTFKTLYNFSGDDGAYPQTNFLLIDASGNLYGTTRQGGAYAAGVVFKLIPSHGQWAESVIYSFTGGADGGFPYSGLIFDSKGDLYGTASQGGDSSCNVGCGTVYKLTKTGDSWSESVLYSFLNNNKDGTNPWAGVTFDRAGNLYGTTYYGGAHEPFGAVFELVKGGSGTWKEKVLYSFTGYDDGCTPTSGLAFDRAGNMYGTTSNFACYRNSNEGTVFQLKKSGKGYRHKVLFASGHDFYGLVWPVDIGSVALDASGNIYGSSYQGGGAGSLFKLRVGTGTYTDLFYFNGTNGANAASSVVLDKKGNLYGTTVDGGAASYGVVYEFIP